MACGAVHSVVLLLAQLKTDSVGKVIANSVGNWINNLMDSVAQKAMVCLAAAMEMAVAGLQFMVSSIITSASQILATISSYRNTLKNPPPNQVPGVATLDIRVRAREGIKSQQVPIDARGHRQGILQGTSNVSQVQAANNALNDLEDQTGQCFVSARQLSNGGVLLEIASEAVASWLSNPRTRASFLGHFAPDATIKDRTFVMNHTFPDLSHSASQCPISTFDSTFNFQSV